MTDGQGTNPDDLFTTHLGGETSKPDLKKAMRDELRRRMAKKTGSSTQVVRQIVDFLGEHPNLRVVALFAPMHGEVDLLMLTKMTEKIWAFPKVTENGLIFHQVTNVGKDLQAGAFGILEPKKCLPRIFTNEIDLFLCPGLGFDTRGGRIGRGKGFYDSALAEAGPNAIRIGICFDYQLLDEVAMESHDIRMHGVIYGKEEIPTSSENLGI